MKTKAVQLNVVQPTDRLVKRTALSTFKALRALAGQASQVPGVLAQAATDVRAAWAESRPNV